MNLEYEYWYEEKLSKTGRLYKRWAYVNHGHNEKVKRAKRLLR